MKDRINEIKSAIIEYCRENLNEQYKDISLDVLAKIEQKDGEILNSSRCDIWVASILNIVLEDAEMFKRKHPMYITKKAFSEKTGVSSKTIKGKSDILRALLDCEQEASAEVAATAETVENNIEALNAEEVKVDTKKELTEEEMLVGRIFWCIPAIHWLLELQGTDNVPFYEWAEDEYTSLLTAFRRYKEILA